MDLLRLAEPVLRRMMGAHATIYRLSGGHVGHRIPGMPPTLLLDHVGARSNTKRTSPLTYFRDGPSLVLMASKGGHPQNPAWFHNLRAHPDTTVQVGTERRQVRARMASPDERIRLWPRALQTYRGYEGYQQRTEREIPLVILEPR